MTGMTKAQLLRQARDIGRVLIEVVTSGKVPTAAVGAGISFRERNASDLDGYRALVAASLVASICDGFAAALAVLRSQGQGHVFSILRSMHEALADLVLLGRDPAYIERLGFVEMQKVLAQLQDLLHRTHRPLLTAEERGRVLEALADCERCLKEMRLAGIAGGLEGDVKFELAGMQHEHRTVRTLLGGLGHNAPGTLGYRYLAADRTHLRLGRRLDRDTLHASVYFACRTLMRAVDQLQLHGIVDKAVARAAVSLAEQKTEAIECTLQLRLAA
jgi:hypothetical protein